MIRKALAWLLTLMMVVSILPMSVFATEEATAEESGLIIGDDVVIIDNEEPEEPADEIELNEAQADPTSDDTTYVAYIGTQGYESVIEALTAAVNNSASEVKILQSVREKMPTDIELVVNADLIITADSAVDVKFYNDGTNYDFIFNSNNNNTITIGENVTFQLEERVIWLGYYGNNVDVVVNGTLAGYQIWHGADTTVNSTGTIKSTGEAFVMRRGATLTVDGGKVDANYFNILAGNIFAENATIDCGAFWIANTGSYTGEGNVSINIGDSTLTSSGNLKSSTDHSAGVSIDIYDSIVSFNDFDGYGASVLDENTVLAVNGENAQLNVKSLTNYGTIDVYDGGKVTATGAVTNEGTIKVEDENDFEGTVSGTQPEVPAPVVAKIGEQSYETLADALAAASAMTGDVTVEIYDKVTLNKALSGSYSSITFVGKDTDAEIYLDVQGYITATGKKVAFEKLTLSKSEGGYIANAGFMNVAFGVYDVVEVTYTNCTFANGAYASSGDVTFTGCKFYRSHDKYGLWAYDNVDVTVEGCEFADYRGIKMYAEGGAKTVDLTVKNTNFSAVNNKPAIVLTYGERVTLEGNTYSSTGVFELDLDGAPNGTTVTSDVAPTCKNDNGACGVLVDGKIYTTVTEAAEVATSGSKVTLLHDSAETVKLPEGVILDKNGFEAAGVTVAQPATPVAYIGETPYTSLQAAINAANGATVTLLSDVTLTDTLTIAAGQEVVLDLNGRTITGKDDVTYGDLAIMGTASLTIKDSSNPSTGKFDGVVLNYGTLTIESGTVTSDSCSSEGVGATIICQPDDQGNLPELNITGGTVSYTGSATLGMAISATKTSGRVTKLYISGGTITSTGVCVFAEATGTISGGTFTGNDLSDYGITNVTLKSGAAITGGTYNTDVSAYVAEGYTMKDNEDGTYGVVVDPAYGKVAKIGGTYYATLEEALAAAKAGDEIVLLADVAEDITVPAGVIFNGNGKQVGIITAAGEITFKGHTKATNFGTQYTNTTINIIEGACLEITGSGRLVIGHGCTFNITGNITDAKTADKATLTPSLVVAAGASFTGTGLNFNVTNAYVKFDANSTSKNSNANGTFNFNVTNSIWEQTGVLAFYVPTSGMDPTFNLNLKDSVLTTTSHLVFSVTKGEIVIDNSNVNVGTSKQLENRSTMTIKNGSVVNGAVATSSNAINPGTIIVENATYAVTGQFSGATVGTGTLIIKKGATVSVGSIVDKANIKIDATGMNAGDVIDFTANLSKFAGTIEVVENDKLEAKIVDGKIVLAAKPVAYIGTKGYETVQAAINAAQAGDTVVIAAGEFGAINISNKNITIQGTVGANGELLTTIKGGNPAITGHGFNGTIKDLKIVDAWTAMYAEPAGNVTVDNVYVTGATYGFHLIAYSTGLTWTIQNSYMDLAWANSFGVYGGGDAAIVIKGNKFESTNPYYPDYGALHVNTFLPNVKVEENVFGEGAKIYIDKSITDTSKINISKNYHADGVANAFADDADGVKVAIDSYYTDEALTNLVYAPKGNNFNAYTGTDGLWGEVWGNAKVSFVIKVLDANGNVMGTTSLNNIGGILNGNVNVTWNLKLDAASNTDAYWDMSWTTAPTVDNMPAKVELWVDGVKVSGGNVLLNGPDDLNKIYAATADDDGKIIAFYTSLADAVAAGNNVVILRAGNYKVPTGKNITITGAVVGVVFDNIGACGMNGASVTFNNVTFNYAENSTYKGLQHSGDLVYNNCTFNGQVFLYGESETFNKCTFNTTDSNNYNVWTYSAKDVTFNECTFKCAGKSVLIYHENASVFNDVTVTKSTFEATQAVDGKAAIEMDSSLTAGIKLTIDDTTATGFGNGNVSGNSLWNNKKGNDADANNDITVVVNGETVLAPKTYVAQIGTTKYESLEDAFKAATNGCTIEILADVTVDGKWDCRDYATNGSHSQFKETVTINGNGHTIKFTGTISDGNWNTIFRFEENATVKNLTIDVSEATGAQRVISAKLSITAENVKIIGNGVKYGIIIGESAGAAISNVTATITECEFTGCGRGVSDNANGQDVKSIAITDSKFTNANVYVSAYETVTFTGNTVENGYVDIRSYTADNTLNVTAKDNTLTANTDTAYNYIKAGGTVNAQDEFVVAPKTYKVSTKAELNAALASAKDGDTIVLTADIDYGTDQLAITKAITLDLGGKTLTTRNAYGGMSVKGNPTIKNGTIVHASNTAAIKVWNATAFEDLVIDVQGKGDANKTIGGIVLQSGSTTRVGSIKNVTIKGAALTNGIETYNCGDAAENVIGSLENVNIEAVGTGMLISALCGTATNCSIKGGTNAIELWIKGTYSASLTLEDCDVVGGVSVHDEFNSADITNNGTLTLNTDDATTGVTEETVTLTINHAEETQVKGEVLETIIEKAQAKVNGTYYATLADALTAAKAGDTVTVFEGTYAVPSMKAGITIVGEGNVVFEGTLSGTLENLTLKNIHIKGGNAQRWAYAKGNLVFDNVTFEATSVYALHFDGIAAGTNLTYKDCTIIGWAAMGGSPESCVFDGCTIKGNGTYGVIRTYFDATIKDCTFDVANVNTNDAYEDGIHAVDGAEVTVTGCTNANGNMKDLVNVHASSVVVLDGEKIQNVAKIGHKYYESLQGAVNAAADGDTIKFIANFVIDGAATMTTYEFGYETLVYVNDKNITIDFNGYTAEVTPATGDNLLETVIYVGRNSTLTLKDSTTEAKGGFKVNKGTTNLYSLIYNCEASLVIENGNYYVEETIEAGSLIYADAPQTTTVYGGTFTLGNASTYVESTKPWIFNVEGKNEEFIDVMGGTYNQNLLMNYGTAKDCEVRIPAEKALVNNGDGTWSINNAVAHIDGIGYNTLAAAVEAVADGGTITLVANETFTESNRANNSGWYDGLYYVGDKSFTIDLGGFTIGQKDGALNDYLLNFKNDGAKANVITLKNGTIDAGTTAFCAICTSTTSTQKITINLEDINVINNISNGSTIKVRGGAELNVKSGTVITGKDSYLGIECVASTVNIYDGAEIYMNGTSSYNGCLVGACGNGTVNVYGGYGKGVSGGFIAMTSGGTINVFGGEWIANTNGTYANSNKSVLVAQSDKGAKSTINVTGGTFKGGYNCYGNAVGDAQIVIKGGNFNANPTTYVADGYEAVETNGTWTVEEAEEKFDITSSSIVLGNELAMYFFVPKADLNGTDYVAVITKSYADGREDLVVEIPYSEWEETSNNRMRFKFDGIAAKEMADNICAVIKNATTNEVVTNEYNDSIRGYVERGFASGNAQKNAELATMLVDMLNYGAAAQQMFTYATDDLANKNMGAYQDQYATKNIDLVNSQNKGTGYKSASLTLKSDILVTMLFYKTNVTQDMTAVVTFTDHYGKAHEIRVTGDKFTDRGNVWGIVVDELVVADASQIITCTFEDASGNVIDGVYGEDSIESVCARAVAGGGGTYYEDIMKFAKAAYNYFN